MEWNHSPSTSLLSDRPQDRLRYRRRQELIPRIRSQIPKVVQKPPRQLLRPIDVDAQRLQEPVDIRVRSHDVVCTSENARKDAIKGIS